ncbi:MAG: tetratricopeptide repeat protein, partial [Pseudomonadota bacterium]
MINYLLPDRQTAGDRNPIERGSRLSGFRSVTGCLFLAFLTPGWPQVPAVSEPIGELVAGIERNVEIAPNQRYGLNMVLASRPSVITVSPGYLGLKLTIRASNGEELLAVDNPFQQTGEYAHFDPPYAGAFVAEISTSSHGPSTDEVTIALAQPTLLPVQYQASQQLTIAGKLGIGVDVSKAGKPLDELTVAYRQVGDLWQIAGDSYQHGRAAMVHGWLAAWDLENGSAEASYELAIELLAQTNPMTPWAYIGLGAAQFQLDNSIAARRSFEEAGRLTKGRDLRANSAATNFLGLLEQSAGRPQEAAHWYREVLAILEQSDYPSQEAVTLGNLGGTYFQMGQFQKALPYFLRALTLHESAGDREEQATMLGNIASLFREQGSLQKSLTYNLQTLDVYRSLSNELGVSLVQHRLGLLYQRMGDYRRAQRFLSQAYASRKAQGSLRRSASSLRALGALHNERGQTQKAQAVLREAIDIYRELDNNSGLARSQAELAE